MDMSKAQSVHIRNFTPATALTKFYISNTQLIKHKKAHPYGHYGQKYFFKHSKYKIPLALNVDSSNNKSYLNMATEGGE